MKSALSTLLLAALLSSASAQKGVYKSSVDAHWLTDNTRFWYRNDLAHGTREFVLVDAEKGTRQPAFDHEKLAKAFDADPARLPLENLDFDLGENALYFRAKGKAWRCDLGTYGLTEAPPRDPKPGDALTGYHPRDLPRGGDPGGGETALVFENKTDGVVELFWRNGGERTSYGKILPGESRNQHTFAGHLWEIIDARGETLVAFRGERQPRNAIITGKVNPRGRNRDGRPSRPNIESAWRVSARNHNLFVRKADGGDEFQLSHDGVEGNGYEHFELSPDGTTLVAFRVEPGENLPVYRIESSPKEGGRVKLQSNPYPLPGDKFAAYELNLFDLASRKQTKPAVERVDFGRPRIRWTQDGKYFTYEKTDRGHQRYRLIRIDPTSGEAVIVIDDRSETFVFTYASSFGDTTRILDATDEVLYASEQDGWRHLYLYDIAKGGLVSQITKGEWVVRGIDEIDEEKRQIWFHASGIIPGQDPYLVHFGRVNFDGSGLVFLTEGDGNHEITYSPDKRYLLDTYSRVDREPTTELRRVADGKLVCALETADITELSSTGWEAPEVFVAKGRDGTTDVWGIVCRPKDFDPSKKYPVLEHIYAGPHDSFVPKSFSASRRFSEMTDLGFVVAKMDGMGTANRSKAFHDVCWQNLKDAGFPDRILWHQAVAAKYPWYDISRVGIYGGSAGGQSSTGALLFYPDFYKVAVSSCGCHDNRMDKASWNEQWMGYPVGPHYAASSNIDHAANLRGHLMLIVGELDNNVPPESTYRLADALIKAGKDFELVVLPGQGHGDGGSYGERKRQDFFRKHLMGIDPPDRNGG